MVSYRQQFHEVLLRQGEEEAEQVEQEYRQAKTRSEQEETAQTLAARRELTADEQGELRKLWKKLVSLYHPDRFAHEPDWVAHAPRVLFAAPSPKTPRHARRTR